MTIGSDETIIKKKNEFGHGALHRAVISNDEKCIQRLVASGYDITEKDSVGFTPIELATILGKENLLPYLNGAYDSELDVSSSKESIVSHSLRSRTSSTSSSISSIRLRVSSILEKQRKASSCSIATTFVQEDNDRFRNISEKEICLSDSSKLHEDCSLKQPSGVVAHTINTITKTLRQEYNTVRINNNNNINSGLIIANDLEPVDKRSDNSNSVWNCDKNFTQKGEDASLNNSKEEINDNRGVDTNNNNLQGYLIHKCPISKFIDGKSAPNVTEDEEAMTTEKIENNESFIAKHGRNCIHPTRNLFADEFTDINNNKEYSIKSNLDATKTTHEGCFVQNDGLLTIDERNYNWINNIQEKRPLEECLSAYKQSRLQKKHSGCIDSFVNHNYDVNLTVGKSLNNNILGRTQIPLRRTFSWPLLSSEFNHASIMEEWEVWDLSDEETNASDSVKLSDESIDAQQKHDSSPEPSFQREKSYEYPSPSPSRRVSVRSSYHGDSTTDIHQSCNLEDSGLLEEVKTVYVFKGNNSRSTENLTKSCDLSAPSKKQSFREAFKNRLSINLEIPSMFSKSKSMENLNNKTTKNNDNPKSLKSSTNLNNSSRSDLTNDSLECDVFQSSDEHVEGKESKHSTSLPVPTFNRSRSVTDTTYASHEEKTPEKSFLFSVPTLSRIRSAESIVKPSLSVNEKQEHLKKHFPRTKSTSSTGSSDNNKDSNEKNHRLRAKKTSDNTPRTTDSGYFSPDDTQKQMLSYSITFNPEDSTASSSSPKDAKNTTTTATPENKKKTKPTATKTPPPTAMSSLQAGLLPLLAVGLGEEEHNTDHVITSVKSPHSVEEHGSFHLGANKKFNVEDELDEYVEIDFATDEKDEKEGVDSEKPGENPSESAASNENVTINLKTTPIKENTGDMSLTDEPSDDASTNNRSCSTPLKNDESASPSLIEGHTSVTPIIKITLDDQLKESSENRDIETRDDDNSHQKNGDTEKEMNSDFSGGDVPGVTFNTSPKDPEKQINGEQVTDNDEYDGEAPFRLMHAVCPDSGSSETYDEGIPPDSPTVRTNDDTPISHLEDSIASFEAHEREFLSNADSNVELSADEEFERMYRDTVDDDAIVNRKMTMDLLSYMPTISETSTELDNFEDKEVNAISEEDDYEGDKENEDSPDEGEHVRALSAENLRLHDLHDQESEDRKSLKDEILEDYINIDFSKNNTQDDNIQADVVHELAAEPDHEPDQNHTDAIDGKISKPQGEDTQKDVDNVLIDGSEQQIDQGEVCGAVIITNTLPQYTTQSCGKPIDDTNTVDDQADFATKYSITLHGHDNNDSAKDNNADEDLPVISTAQYTVNVDESHEAIVKCQTVNSYEPTEDGSNEGKGSFLSDSKLDTYGHKEDNVTGENQICDPRASEIPENITLEGSPDKQIVIDLTEDNDADVEGNTATHSDKNEKDEITELPAKHYPSLRHLPKQQTIENAMRINELRKHESLKRDPSLAWDDFQTSYNEGDSYYSDNNPEFYKGSVSVDENDDSNDVLLLAENVKNNQNNQKHSDHDEDNRRNSRTKDYDSASDKATEMYESIENGSMSSEGDEQHMSATIQSSSPSTGDDTYKHLDDNIQSINLILTTSEDDDKCSKQLESHIIRQQTYSDFFLELSGTPPENLTCKNLKLAGKLYRIIEENQLCSFMMIMNNLLCHLGVLKSEEPLKEKVNISNMLNFLTQLVQHGNLSSYHIQTLAYFLAKPSLILSPHKPARILLLQACFTKEMELLKQNKIPTVEYATAAFRKLCEYLFNLDADKTKELACQYITSHITKNNSSNFIKNVSAYMGLTKSETPVPTTENLKPALIMLYNIIDSANTQLSDKCKNILSESLRQSWPDRFCIKQKDVLHEKLNML